MRYRPINITPGMGGQLMGDVSGETVGIQNYVDKLNFRRDLDKEIRREGADHFNPKNDANIQLSSNPSGGSNSIAGIYTAERANGERAILIAVDESDGVHIYRYRGADDGTYIDTDYWYDDYVSSEFDEWYELTQTPLASKANRIQWLTINGITIINNGVDLPVAWSFEWDYVRPLYQLRENGIISADSMTEYSGMVFFGNVLQLASDVDIWTFADPYGATEESQSRFHSRLVFSEINDPLKWAAPIKVSIEAGEFKATVHGQTKRFSQGDQVTITGAGLEGGNLTAKVFKVTDSYILIDARASTTVSKADLADSTAATSYSGFDDLADDGDAINNMAALQNSLIVYKDKEIVVVEFTANADNPFDYRLIRTAENNLYFKNTLYNLDGESHFFCGRDGFYLFSLSDGAPREIQLGRYTKSVFFNSAFINNTKDVFVSQNLLTNEIWIHHKDLAGNRAELCFNYQDQSFSVCDFSISASTMIFKPGSAAEESLFLMGRTDGVLQVYGLADKPQAEWGNSRSIHYRRHTADKTGYTSRLKSGRGDFGDQYNEKTLRSYVLIAASTQPSDTNTVKVKLTTFLNPFDTTGSELMDGGEYTLPSIETQNLIPLFGKAHLIQDTITIEGMDNPFELSARIFDVAGVATYSDTRKP